MSESDKTDAVDKPENDKPRRVGIIGHIDHGKTSLTAALIALGLGAAGLDKSRP